jgi:hypothetical protein
VVFFINLFPPCHSHRTSEEPESGYDIVELSERIHEFEQKLIRVS